MRTRIGVIVLLLVCVTGLVLAQSGQDLYQRGLGREQLGDYDQAIKIYERIVRDFAQDRALVAKAKVRLGDSLMKQGEARGLEFLNDVIRDHKDQPDVVAEARGLTLARRGWADVSSNGNDAKIETPPSKDFYSFAISPNGRRLVYQATISGTDQLWLHDLDKGSRMPIPGTEGAAELSFPFWSPDGNSIGFFAEGKLKRVDVAGGPAIVLAAAPWNRGGTWGKGDVIIFAPFHSGPLHIIPAKGGTPVAYAPGSAVWRQFPQFLPDGRRFIYLTDAPPPTRQRWMLGSLDNSTSEPFPATLGNRGAGWVVIAPPNRMFWEGVGFAMADLINPESLQRLQLIGDSARVTPAIAGSLLLGKAPLSPSAAGPIAYRKEATVQRSLIWRDRQGRKLSSYDLPLGATKDLRLSHDGKWLLFRSSSASDDILSKDLFRLDMTTSGPVPRMVAHGDLINGGTFSPVWSPDSSQVAFSQRRDATYSLFTQRADQLDLMILKDESSETRFPSDWSEDLLLYEKLSMATGADLFAMPAQGGVVTVAATTAMESAGRISPNGQWIAYQSNQEGRNEIYVQPFPGSPDLRRRVSTGGGKSPEWRPDGTELYFLSSENQLMAAAIGTDGKTLTLGKPAALFALPDDSTYAPARDGRFLINAPAGGAPPIAIVSNWTLPAVDQAASQSRIVVLDRQGNRLRSIDSPDPTSPFIISPNGKTIAILRGQDVWTIDTENATWTRVIQGMFTTPGMPAWSSDSASIAYTANRNPQGRGGSLGTALYVTDLDSRTERPLAGASRVVHWALNGSFMLVVVNGSYSLLPATGDSRTPRALFPTGSTGVPRLSPNSQFVAYPSSDNSDLWVQQIATSSGDPINNGMKWKVATGGAVGLIRWRSDGRELFYLAHDGNVMSVSITMAPEFASEPPKRLFPIPSDFRLTPNAGIYSDISADGQQFMFITDVPTAAQRNQNSR